jgi:hypothetical protein
MKALHLFIVLGNDKKESQPTGRMDRNINLTQGEGRISHAVPFGCFTR